MSGKYRGTSGTRYDRDLRMKTQIKNLPQSYRNRSGKLGFLRGRREGPNDSRVQLYAWDFVRDCLDEACPVYDYCEKQPTGSHLR